MGRVCWRSGVIVAGGWVNRPYLKMHRAGDWGQSRAKFSRTRNFTIRAIRSYGIG